MPGEAAAALDWRGMGLRYYSFQHYLQHRFGQRVQKISLDGGFYLSQCGRDGRRGGCTFCDNRSFSPSRRQPRFPIAEQLAVGIAKLRRRYPKCQSVPGLFQPATNTYAPVDTPARLVRGGPAAPARGGPGHRHASRLRPAGGPGSAGGVRRPHVSIGRIWGTDNPQSLVGLDESGPSPRCVRRCHGAQSWPRFSICAHVMLGLPGEYARGHARHGPRDGPSEARCAVKIHNLYAVKATPLAEQWQRGEVRLMERQRLCPDADRFSGVLPPRHLGRACER